MTTPAEKPVKRKRRSGMSAVSPKVTRAKPLSDNTAKKAAGPKRQSRGRRIRSDEQRELISIRERIGLSQAAFATALGVNRDRIVNIENGRVLNIPDDVLAAAREMLNDPARLERIERLRKAHMSTLVDDWMARLGLKTGGFKPHDEVAADLLQVHVNTIYRWRKNVARPDPEALLQMDRLVEILSLSMNPDAVQKAIERAAKAIAEEE